MFRRTDCEADGCQEPSAGDESSDRSWATGASISPATSTRQSLGVSPPGSGAITVTQVAKLLGFPDCGRFSAWYREISGEFPDVILKRPSDCTPRVVGGWRSETSSS